MIHKNIRLLIEKIKDAGLDVNNILLFVFNVKEQLGLNVDLSDEDHMFLIQEKIITKNYVTNTFECLIPFYEHEEGIELVDMNPIKNVLENISNNIDEYRKLFQGIRVGILGDKNECINNMARFIIENPDVTFDEILEATSYYIWNTEAMYISKAPNFIYAVDKTGREQSKLKSIIEEMRMGGQRKSKLL